MAPSDALDLDSWVRVRLRAVLLHLTYCTRPRLVTGILDQIDASKDALQIGALYLEEAKRRLEVERAAKEGAEERVSKLRVEIDALIRHLCAEGARAAYWRTIAQHYAALHRLGRGEAGAEQALAQASVRMEEAAAVLRALRVAP